MLQDSCPKEVKLQNQIIGNLEKQKLKGVIWKPPELISKLSKTHK